MNLLTRLINSVDSPDSLRLLSTVTILRKPVPLERKKLDTVSYVPFLTGWFRRLAISSVSGDRGIPAATSRPFASGESEVRGMGEPRKLELPKEYSGNVVFLTCESTAEGGMCDVYVVGTAHVSKKSCREVQAIIRTIKPQAVFLELCKSRASVLTKHNFEVPTMEQIVGMLRKEHNMFGVLYSWFLAKVASRLEVVPGTEFRVAYEEAKKYGGRVLLGDRPVKITLRRAMAKMPLQQKLKLLYSFLFQCAFMPSSDELKQMLKEMDCMDMVTLTIQQLSKEFPAITETLINERDQYMSSMLLDLAKDHSSVVAVVGKGHLPGIKNYWKQPVQLEDLMEIPAQKPALWTRKMLASLGLCATGAAIVSGIYILPR